MCLETDAESRAGPLIIARRYTYAYDHAGSRVLKDEGTTTTVYPNKYFDTDGTTPTKHIYAGGEVVATVEDNGTTVTANTVHTDLKRGMAFISAGHAAAQESLN